MESDMKRQLLKSITLQHIEIYLTVARHRNLSRASKELYISQPAISSRLKQLEEAVGVDLFMRTNHGIELTHEGNLLQAQFELVYHRFRITLNNLVREARHTPGLCFGSLHITDVLIAMESTAEKFSHVYTEQKIDTEYYQYNELMEKLLCHELDVIFTLLYEVENIKAFENCVVGSAETCLIFPRTWGKIPTDDLSFLSEKTLLLGLNNGRNRVMEICRKSNFIPADIRYQSSDFMLSRMIADGNGFTVSSNLMVFGEQYKPYIYIVPLPEYSEPVVAAWRRGENAEWFSLFKSVL